MRGEWPRVASVRDEQRRATSVRYNNCGVHFDDHDGVEHVDAQYLDWPQFECGSAGVLVIEIAGKRARVAGRGSPDFLCEQRGRHS